MIRDRNSHSIGIEKYLSLWPWSFNIAFIGGNCVLQTHLVIIELKHTHNIKILQEKYMYLLFLSKIGGVNFIK